MQHSADPREPDPDFIKWLRENCVPIVGKILGALVVCWVTRYSSITVDWARTKDFTEACANASQSLALIGGGVWAYFKFAKGRTFQDRLIPNVSGRFVSIDESVFDQEVSSLVVFEYVPSQAEEILSVKKNRLTSFKVFGDTDRYIEPNRG